MKTKLSPVVGSTIIIITFLIAFYGKRIANNYFDFSLSNPILYTFYFYSWWLLPTIFAISCLYGFRNVIKEAGLQKNPVSGLVFALVTVSPMFISSAIIGNISGDLDLGILIRSSLIAGFMEEYLFRGFLFGILFRKFLWGFIPSAVLGAFFFGLGHIYQGNHFFETMGIFLITSMGALWFAWLYIEWNENLWVPVFLHVFMNLSWGLFDISNNALGDVYANIFRILTITLTIVITVFYNKNRGLKIKKGHLIIHYNKN
ncbi:MAG: CPBP family intramembrane metalloprotease [Ignavibacterium sp.]|nr:CPBP family intramembrane metalloprotease [Ignavibacterium sp.]